MIKTDKNVIEFAGGISDQEFLDLLCEIHRDYLDCDIEYRMQTKKHLVDCGLIKINKETKENKGKQIPER